MKSKKLIQSKRRASKAPAAPFNGVDLIDLEDRINDARNGAALCWLAVPSLVDCPTRHGANGLQRALARLQDDLHEIAKEITQARA